jgi:hypothetical protein
MQAQPITPCDPRALGNLKHGLTGRIFLFSEADQSTYDNLYRGSCYLARISHRPGEIRLQNGGRAF